MCIFGYLRGPGWPINNRTWLSSHLYQSTYKIWKQSYKDFLSYRENDEMSAETADAAERRLNHSIPRTYIRMGDTITYNLLTLITYRISIKLQPSSLEGGSGGILKFKFSHKNVFPGSIFGCFISATTSVFDFDRRSNVPNDESSRPQKSTY